MRGQSRGKIENGKFMKGKESERKKIWEKENQGGESE